MKVIYLSLFGLMLFSFFAIADNSTNSSSDGWDEFADDNSTVVGENLSEADNESSNILTQNDSSDGGIIISIGTPPEDAEKRYNENFYQAIQISTIAALLLILLLYLLLRKPHNKWKENTPK